MQRLLSDAEALTGKKYNLDNLGDVYEAIHVIQEDLGLTGVAAAEAEGTFSGSFNAMKAAAQNFLGSLAIGEDVSASLNTLIGNATTFVFNNLIPMIGTIVKGIPGAIVTFLKIGMPMLVSNITSLLTSLAANITSMANGLTGEKVSAWATTAIPKFLSAAGTLIGQFAMGLITNIPKIAAALVQIGGTIVNGLGSALWGKVKAAAAGIRDKFMEPINQIKDKVQAAIQKVKNLFPFSIGKVMSNIKLPHFSVSGKFGLNPPSVPKLSIKWYAKGGIFDAATVFGGIGVGEAGPEAILPLDPFWKKMDEIANRVQGGNTFNFYINGSDKDPKEIAEEVKRVLIKEANQRRLAW